MRALVKAKSAPGLWLQDVPKPEPGPDDVLIKRLSENDKNLDDQIICDHDAEDQATLRENGLQTMNADKRVSVGLDAVMERVGL